MSTLILDPPDIDQTWLQAMKCGDFEAAWRETDRIEIPRHFAQVASDWDWQPCNLVWDGSSFKDRTVHVRCEHGLGDTIQFLRYLPRLRKRARHVTVSVQPLLLELAAAFSGIDTLRDGWSSIPAPFHDVEIECMEFPYAFRDSEKSIPASVPYLKTPLIRSLSRTFHLGRTDCLRVGLIWQSSPWDTRRSVPFSLLEELWKVPGCAFYSLQQDVDYATLENAGPLQNLADQTGEIVDAAGAMLEMDLIITVDSMPAHLAGALGIPVWIMLRDDPDWRWMVDRADSPWYPQGQLFRQPQPGDWRGLIRQISNELRKFAARKRTV